MLSFAIGHIQSVISPFLPCPNHTKVLFTLIEVAPPILDISDSKKKTHILKEAAAYIWEFTVCCILDGTPFFKF